MVGCPFKKGSKKSLRTVGVHPEERMDDRCRSAEKERLMKIQTGSKLLFQGDSVTDAGRTRPISEGLHNPLGRGYPNIVNGLLTAVYPERMIRVVNMGNSGDNTRSLLNRWQTDTLDLKPDWLSIMIGVNDVWRQFDVPYMKERHVLIGEYESNLRKIIELSKPVIPNIVLMTPYYMEPNREDAMRAMIDRYGEVCRRLAEEYQLIFVDVQAAFDKVLEHCHSSYFSWDRVHPAAAPGHSVIARAFLKAVEFDFNA